MKYNTTSSSMIISKHEQGTKSWMAERVGIPTASNFDKVFTTKGVKSAQADAYMNALLAEWMIGEKEEIKQSEWMLRGIEMEAEARSAYEFITDRDVECVGFCFKGKDKLCGASPDGFIDENGLVEFKCPKPGTHVGYMLANKLPATYIQQVQGQLWVTGRGWCDFVSYCPGMKPVIITVHRDDKLISAIDKVMTDFIGLMLEKRTQLERLDATF